MRVKLKDICDLQNGYAFKSKDYIKFSNTLICRMSNIKPVKGFDITYNPKYINDNDVPKYEKYILKDNDIIIAMTDLANDPKILGVPVLVKTNGKTILQNQRVGKLIIKSNNVYPSFLMRVLSTKQARHFYKKFSNGGLQINIGKNEILENSIPLPPLEQQKAIAKKLDKAQELVELRKSSIKKLDELSKTLFVDMFGDPVENEMGWEKRTLNSIFKVQHGFAFKSEFFQENGDYVLLTPGNFFEKGGYKDRGIKQKYYVGKIPKEYILEKNTLLLAMTEQAEGLLGSPLVVPESNRFLHNQRLGLISPKEPIEVNFLFHLFNQSAIRTIIHFKATGIKVRHTSPTKIEEIVIGYPPLPLQQKFAKTIEKIEAQKALYEEELKGFEDLFASLLSESFA